MAEQKGSAKVTRFSGWAIVRNGRLVAPRDEETWEAGIGVGVYRTRAGAKARIWDDEENVVKVNVEVTPRAR